jgi:glycosyl transferase family 1
MGRRSEVAHRALLDLAARGEAFYIYDTIPGLLIQPRDHNQHRDLVANLAKRSRFFVTYPAKVDCADETRGQSEVGARFFEGAASGAILIGQSPTIAAFARDFPWPDAVVNLGATAEEVVELLARWRKQPERAAALHRTNAVAALRHFDWAYRWKEMLRTAGLAATPQLLAREKHLHQLAAAAEEAPLFAPTAPSLDV